MKKVRMLSKNKSIQWTPEPSYSWLIFHFFNIVITTQKCLGHSSRNYGSSANHCLPYIDKLPQAHIHNTLYDSMHKYTGWWISRLNTLVPPYIHSIGTSHL